MEKVEQVKFSVAIVLFDMKMYQNSTLRNSRGQCYLVTMAKGHLSVVCQHFQSFFTLKLLGHFHLNSYAASRHRGER